MGSGRFTAPEGAAGAEEGPLGAEAAASSSALPRPPAVRILAPAGGTYPGSGS